MADKRITDHPPAGDRVRRVGPNDANVSIDQTTLDRLEAHAESSDQEIEQRLQKLDREWSFDRLMAAQGAVVGLSGMLLALFSDQLWLVMTAFALVMLLAYAVFGWCPPVETLRRLNIRTEQEIARERYALKALRGDFARTDITGQDRSGRDRARTAYDVAAGIAAEQAGK